MFATMFKNWWTTLIGFLLGAAQYLATTGPQAPATKQDWINLVVGVLLAGLGLASKDSTTGSKP